MASIWRRTGISQHRWFKKTKTYWFQKEIARAWIWNNKRKGYLIAGERLRIVTYKDERDFNHCKEILEDVGYKKEDQGDYIIWSDNRIKEVKKWLQVGEELGYFKIADLEKRKLIDLKKGLKKLNLK